mmetsp:Transcript_17267/g.42869  ORF Transcript_17267/g.42869 Transcript_17267/m.42869 type:complete len:441 (+) Transcript_17267:5083-6405(+)
MLLGCRSPRAGLLLWSCGLQLPAGRQLRLLLLLLHLLLHHLMVGLQRRRLLVLRHQLRVLPESGVWNLVLRGCSWLQEVLVLRVLQVCVVSGKMCHLVLRKLHHRRRHCTYPMRLRNTARRAGREVLLKLAARCQSPRMVGMRQAVLRVVVARVLVVHQGHPWQMLLLAQHGRVWVNAYARMLRLQVRVRQLRMASEHRSRERSRNLGLLVQMRVHRRLKVLRVLARHTKLMERTRLHVLVREKPSIWIRSAFFWLGRGRRFFTTDHLLRVLALTLQGCLCGVGGRAACTTLICRVSRGPAHTVHETLCPLHCLFVPDLLCRQSLPRRVHQCVSRRLFSTTRRLRCPSRRRAAPLGAGFLLFIFGAAPASKLKTDEARVYFGLPHGSTRGRSGGPNSAFLPLIFQAEDLTQHYRASAVRSGPTCGATWRRIHHGKCARVK